MKKFKNSLTAIALCIFAGLSVSIVADDEVEEGFLSGWSINGQNTVHFDRFDDYGDETASPYPQVGPQFYDDLSLFANRRVSAFEKIDVQAFGTLNDSEYRSTETGLMLERGKIAWEKGDSTVPFRMELGDFFAQQTYRTLQRSLKGVQLELQPQFSADRQHSFQLFAGLTDPIYRDLDDNIGFFTGGSWVMEDDVIGALSITSVFNYQEGVATATTNGPDSDQWVNSLAWAKEFTLGTQIVEAESELAYFTGDTTSSNVFERNDDFGVFAQLAGFGTELPYDYRLRYERYGEDFQPAGAAISSNQQTIEGHAGWRYESGLQLRGRVQTFRTALESNNYTDTDVFGINLTGPFVTIYDRVITGQLDAFHQDIESENHTTNTRTRSLNTSIFIPLTQRLFFRPGVFYTHIKNQNGGAVTVNRQLSLPFDYTFTIGEFSGTFSPGVVLRNNSGGGRSGDDINPLVALTMIGGPHSIQLSYNALIQDANLATNLDATTQQSSLRYTYTRDKHQLGLEADYFGRDPQPGLETDAYHIGVFWTYFFDKPAEQPKTITTAARSTEILPGQLDLIDFAPGTPMDEIEHRLASSGIKQPQRLGGLYIYETRIYEDIQRRQRLGFVSKGGEVDKTVLVIDFRNTGDVDSVAQTYERVREKLNQRYGTPAVQFEEGEFSTQIVSDLSAGRFRRLNEWSTPNGKLRFGIPNRTDGQVRMEIIFTDSFPPYSNNNWGIEELR